MSFQYILRRTMPPWSFEENLRELETAMKEYRLDEIMLKVDTEEFSHGQPELPWLENYLPMMSRLAELCASAGVRFSINPWITSGHLDRGRDGTAQLPGLQTVVDLNGNQSSVCACQLSPVWRDHIRKCWSLYASLHPYAIWIEDDIRNHNHGAARQGCFCPLHLERFAAVNGLGTIDRETVKSVLWQPGTPHPWREKYLDMMNDITCETVKMLRETVQGISPGTHLGLMHSTPRVHVIEGRDWKKLFAELDSGGVPAFVRPPMAPYREASPRQLYSAADSLAQSRYVCGAHDDFSEVENCPYSRYAKSVAMTRAELLLSASSGCEGGAMNLFDHFGSPMEMEPGYGKMLAATRDDLDALRQSCHGGKLRGVRLLHHDDCGKKEHVTPSPDFYQYMAPGLAASFIMQSCGFPISYEDDAASVTVISGEVVRALRDDEIATMLNSGKGLFLDAVAAKILCEMGYREMIGLSGVGGLRHPEEYRRAAAEEFFNERFGGGAKMFASAYVPTYGPNIRIAPLELAADSEALSALCDCNAERLFATGCRFVNRASTRIAIHGMAWDHTGMDQDFLSPVRAKIFRNLVDWLSGGRADIAVQSDCAYIIGTAMESTDGTMIVGVINLSTDILTRLDIAFGKAKFSSVERLQDGKWRRISGLSAGNHLVYNCGHAIYHGECFRFVK